MEGLYKDIESLNLMDRRLVEDLVSQLKNKENNTTNRKPFPFEKYGKPTERGRNVEAYMREMRENDRI